MNTTELSKLTSYALRHRPREFGLVPDAQGWVNIADVVDAVRKHSPEYRHITVEDLQRMVDGAHKKRYEIHGAKIRALYGHSAGSVQSIERTPGVPPAILYHGTPRTNWERIQHEGLKPGRRQSVHLTEHKKDAVAVGRRHGSDVVLLEADAIAAHQSGTVFYPSSSGVWLVDSVPAHFVVLAL